MLECDYLIVGSGANAMAFVDELFHSTKDTTFVIVDRHHQPGGHWNDAYEFVTLHQPAQYYGVPSKQLGKGNNYLASFNEIRAYYEDVMAGYLASGRVRFYPQCEYIGNNVFHSLLECGLEYTVRVHRKTVDATYVGPSVPSTRKPGYEVDEGARVVPVNGLVRTMEPWERYVVVGGGKTGIDAVLYLLHNHVKPDRISWIIPNDYWVFNRRFLFTENLLEIIEVIFESAAEVETCDDLFKSWEKAGMMMRLDTSVEPRAFKAGTVTEGEMSELRLVTNIIRHGRVKRITKDLIVFQDGSTVETTSKTLHVDCTGNGANPFLPKPIFQGSQITLQNVRLFQTCYSASVVGAFEARFPDDEERKNRVLIPLTHPQDIQGYVRLLKQELVNNAEAAKELGMRWMRGNRLDNIYHMPLWQFLKLMYYAYSMVPKVMANLDKMVAKMDENLQYS